MLRKYAQVPTPLLLPGYSCICEYALRPRRMHAWEVIKGLAGYFFVRRNFKGGTGSFLTPRANAMEQRPYWPSRMEESYCTFGFGAIIWRDLHILSLLHYSPRDNLYTCRKGNSRLTKLLGGLKYEKILWYNNSPPYVTARWPSQQIPL